MFNTVHLSTNHQLGSHFFRFLGVHRCCLQTMNIKTCSILTSEFLFYILISDQIADFCHFDQETLQFTVRSYNFMHICQKSGSFAIKSSEISELWQHCALKSGSLAIKRFWNLAALTLWISHILWRKCKASWTKWQKSAFWSEAKIEIPRLK